MDAIAPVWQSLSDTHPACLALSQVASTLPKVLASSEFVTQAVQLDQALLPALVNDARLFESVEAAWLRARLDAALAMVTTDADLFAALRRYRREQMVRIAWRDIANLAPLEEILLDLSNLADVCVQCVYEKVYAQLSAAYGTPMGRDSGQPQPMLILGMGKLGGRELNYSSDIDLIFAYPESGETNAAEPMDNAEFFLRLGQKLIQWLANKTADGFVFRVDMRLRPFGESGPLAVSFDSLEDYLQQHGREWERYAFVKARPITAIDQYDELYRNVVRPFVYRRYLDFSVFDSLRTMRQLILREVARRELHEHVKLGPGGIREVEFIVQAFQLLRGGHDRHLQTRELQTALSHLVGKRLLPEQAQQELRNAYRFLRLTENRLQEWRDHNTHELPDDEVGKQRLAMSLDHASWPIFLVELNQHRERVSHWFRTLVFGGSEPAAEAASAVDMAGFMDSNITRTEQEALVATLGITPVSEITTQLLQIRDSGYYRRLDATARDRLHVLVPKALRLIAKHDDPLELFTRVLRIIEMIGGRTVYLALLNENPAVLARLIDLCARSGFLAEQIATFPLLLDELIDAQLFNDPPTRESLQADLQLKLRGADEDDDERQIELLREYQRVAMFRIAVADLSGNLPLMKVSDRLTELAELIVQRALVLAWNQLARRHGQPCFADPAGQSRTAGVVIVAYGKFGGIELGYGSDLDLVFLHDSPGLGAQGGALQTDGEQPLDHATFFARLGQRLMHLLTVYTRAGRLYEVDVRLRPNGKGGLLVQSLHGFHEYQQQEAWTWEHQALLRARVVAGTDATREAFDVIRMDVLRHAIKRDNLREEVRKMRQRMRDELSNAQPGQFDLKQDPGGIADIEFLVQYWMLKWACDWPPIILFTDNIRQLQSLGSANLIPHDTVDFLTDTYRRYRARMHHLSLAGGGHVIGGDEFAAERQCVVALWNNVMIATEENAALPEV